MIKYDQLVEGKYYKAVFNSGGTYYCVATSFKYVDSFFCDGEPYRESGTLRHARITEVSEACARSAGRAVSTNREAKSMLDTDY